MLKEAMSRGYCCLNFTKAIIVISRTLRMRSSFAYHLLAAFESSNLPSKYVKPQYITIMHLIFNPPPPRLPPASPPPPKKNCIIIVPRICSGYCSPKRTKEMFCKTLTEGGGGIGEKVHYGIEKMVNSYV